MVDLDVVRGRLRRAGGAHSTGPPEAQGADDGGVVRSHVRRAVVRFVLFGLLALVIVASGTLLIAEKVVRGEVLRHAQRTTRDIADTLIAPVAEDAFRQRDPRAMAELDRVMSDRMADGSLMRVKVWSAEGVVVWSDDSRLIGQRFPLEPKDARLLHTLAATSEFTELDRAENAYDPRVDELVEVYLGFKDRTGEPFLLELYVTTRGLETESEAQLKTLLPLTVGGPALLLLVLFPLALSMARRIDQAGTERTTLLRRAVEASALERRRIAGDLHDGVVQDLAGIGYALPAIGDALPQDEGSAAARQKLERVTQVVARDIAALRSVITDIYPPDLHEEGLVPASQQLVGEVRNAGFEVHAHFDPALSRRALHPDAAVLAYRVLREALRNVVRHSEGTRAEVSVHSEDEQLSVRVADDGVGFDPDAPVEKGHYGLRLLEDTVRDVGGRMTVRSVPGHGTEVVVRFPLRWKAVQ